MDWLFEADRDAERRFPWISIPGVASIVYWVKSVFGTSLARQNHGFIKRVCEINSSFLLIVRTCMNRLQQMAIRKLAKLKSAVNQRTPLSGIRRIRRTHSTSQ